METFLLRSNELLAISLNGVNWNEVDWILFIFPKKNNYFDDDDVDGSDDGIKWNELIKKN